MAPVTFTRREMHRAWRNNLQAYKKVSKPIENAYRLLLFYAIECGLKAILMKRQGSELTSDCEDISNAQHDINRLLISLRANDELKLPAKILLSSVRSFQKREVSTGQINQVWRYGGEFENNTSQIIEQKLLKISQWIAQELN